MPIESSPSGRVILLRKGDELILGRGLASFSESLDSALAKFYRKSKTRTAAPSSAEDSLIVGYGNDSHLAASDFGLVLIERVFGEEGEQTFFEEFPSAKYFVLEGRGQFANTDNNFYRLGFIFARLGGVGDTMVGIDPIYNRGGIRTAVFYAGSDVLLYQLLAEHYGGSWKAENVFHPETGKYEWLENRTVKSFFPKKKE